MEKKESSKIQDMKNQNFEARKFKSSIKSRNQKDNPLPWWVELLFVQIGLPDKLLVKILKFKKNSNELIINNKKLIFIFLFILFGMAYFYPVIKNSKNKLDCETTAKNYFTKNPKLNKIDRKQLKMLSTNFCNGGTEFNEIRNLKR